MLFGERLLMLGPELALIGQTRVCPRKSISLFNILKDLIGIAAFPQIRILILKFHDRKIKSTCKYMKELIKVREIWQIIISKHSPINQQLGIDGLLYHLSKTCYKNHVLLFPLLLTEIDWD